MHIAIRLGADSMSDGAIQRPLCAAICIVGFNNVDDIRRCLAALEKSVHTDFRVIVCENGGHSAWLRLRAAVNSPLPGGQDLEIVEAPRNLGYAGGVNVCMAKAPDVDAWWILNPDTLPDREALQQMLARLARGDCDAVGSTICTEEGQVESRGGQWRALLARAVSIDQGAGLAAPCDEAAVERRLSYLSGASMLVGRNFLERAGPMREDYFLYGEEVEWCIRAQTRGARLAIASAARVVHLQGTTTGSVSDVAQRSRTSVYLDERNKLLLTRDRFARLLPAAALGALGLLVLRFGRRRAWKQLGFAITGWFAGLRNQRGAPPWIKDA